jgi:hypothetical protein
MPRAKLAHLSVDDLKKEISRRQKALSKLIAKRDALNCQITGLESLGVAMPPAAKLRKGRRAGRRAMWPPRPGSLRSALVETLTSKGKLSVAEAAEAVREAGYKSRSKNFQKVVGITLSQGRRFRRIGRGVYSLNDQSQS